VQESAQTLIQAPWQRRLPSWRDLGAVVLILAVLLALATAAHQMTLPWTSTNARVISLSPSALPLYALRTTARMLIALGVSLLFTLIYATIAAKSRRAEMVMIPLLDVLQSVPILGYLSFTVVFFIRLFPGSTLGPECAAIFAIFTSQAWNMAFSFYQSLRTLPRDLEEASSAFRFSAWQRFWRLEAPFAMPGLIWNMMMSMSGGWFFVVAAEAFTVGDVSYVLPGIGSYVARAIEQQNLHAIVWAIVAMTLTIVIYDQLLFRPLVVWAEKFRAEQSAAAAPSSSPLLDLFRRSKLLRAAGSGVQRRLHAITRARLTVSIPLWNRRPRLRGPAVNAVWYALILCTLAGCVLLLARFIGPILSLTELWRVMAAGALTFLRVAVLILLATVIWVPIGVAVGIRPRLAQAVQPVAQFFAAFPANLLFPVFVLMIVRLRLDPRLWLSPLMILGTQWYILFNVIAGASAFPGDLREAAGSFRIRGWRWWRQVMLPGIFPYFVTGAITASGGAWNASIVAESVSWGHTHLTAGGLGAYIAQMTEEGDYPRIALGIAVMSMLVIATNRMLWRPLYIFAERRTRLD
jgi:NitT/TauT family transport system permease protein